MNDSSTNNKKVVKAVREAIISAAKEATALKQKSVTMAGKVEKGWNDSKPQREKAKSDLKKVGNSIADFARDVAQGMKEGIEEVKKNKSQK